MKLEAIRHLLSIAVISGHSPICCPKDWQRVNCAHCNHNLIDIVSGAALIVFMQCGTGWDYTVEGRRKEVVDAMLELYGDSWWISDFYSQEDEHHYQERLRAIVKEMANA